MDNKLLLRPAALLAAAAGLLLPAPALAAGASYSYAKSEAILGGSSRLAAIMAKQGGTPAPLAASATLQPAAYSRPQLSAAMLSRGPLVSPAVASGRPDLFGTIALRVGTTRLDARWRKVEDSGVGGSAGDYATSLRDADAVSRIDAVNRYVNGRVAFVDDIRQYGREDVWTAAAQTLARGRGDCEDYAIAKMQMLRRAGIADRDMYLVIVKDLVRRSDHAVLVVRAAGRMLLLDNGTDRVADADSVSDYRPILTFAATGTWTHGYRRASPLIEMASVDLAPLAPAADASRD